MRISQHLLLGAALSTSSVIAGSNLTEKHEAGRCAIRGHCGKQGFFGSDLPCPDNGLAEEPTKDERKKLVDICGDAWEEGKVCCTDEQVCDLLWSKDSLYDESSLRPRLMLCQQTSTKRRPSYPRVPLAKLTSTNFSAPSPVPLTSRYSSMSRKQSQRATNTSSPN